MGFSGRTFFGGGECPALGVDACLRELLGLDVSFNAPLSGDLQLELSGLSCASGLGSLRLRGDAFRGGVFGFLLRLHACGGVPGSRRISRAALQSGTFGALLGFEARLRKLHRFGIGGAALLGLRSRKKLGGFASFRLRERLRLGFGTGTCGGFSITIGGKARFGLALKLGLCLRAIIRGSDGTLLFGFASARGVFGERFRLGTCFCFLSRLRLGFGAPLRFCCQCRFGFR
jgi:hypothetical protein